MLRPLVGACVLTALAAGCAGRDDAVARTTSVSAPQDRLTDADLEKLMQRIGPGYQSLRKMLQDGALENAAREAQQLAELFGGVEKFWTQHRRPDAASRAGEARSAATQVAGNAAAGDGTGAVAAAEQMGGVCKQCHGTYRESDGQGGYRIKPGVLQ
jgi:hypothetical protein